MNAPIAYRAKYIVTMASEKASRGSEMLAPVAKIDHGQMIVCDNHIVDISRSRKGRLPPGCKIADLGDVTILPPLINAHAHIQLSWLYGKTVWKKGFVKWLKSLVPLLSQTSDESFMDESSPQSLAIKQACQELKNAGTRFAGDFGGSSSGALSRIQKISKSQGIEIINFCEWFGFTAPFVDDNYPWPPKCRDELIKNAKIRTVSAPAGHALYSTSPLIMKMAYSWCRRHNRTFSFHLAESDEETELLEDGSGPLLEFYYGRVIPESWRRPGASPFEYASQLGIIGENTLAVHGVKLSDREIDRFAESGAALCVCPRSNCNLGVGLPRAKKLLQSGVLLCLGSDGLSSCEDLDVRNDAMFLRNEFDFPPQALWRMLTANGAAALGIERKSAMLIPGNRACFSVWPA